MDCTVNEYGSVVLFPGHGKLFLSSITEVNMYLSLLNPAVLAGTAEAPVVSHILMYLPHDVVQYLPSGKVDCKRLTMANIKDKLLKDHSWDCSMRDQCNAMQAVHIATATVEEVTSLNTFVSVEVVHMADIKLDLCAMPQVTNLQPDAAYYLPVRFFDANHTPLTNAPLGPGMPTAHDMAYMLTWFHILVKEWLFTSENDGSSCSCGQE